MYQPTMNPLPDVAAQKVDHQDQAINWVGMGELRQPLLFVDGDITKQVLAKCEAFVNLVEGGVRGIHMSRLYLLTDAMKGCSKAELSQLLESFIQTHSDMSNAARLQLNFDLVLKRRALVSENYGWRAYPVTLEAILDAGGLKLELGVEIDYSSTCPCSKALAEQMVLTRFNQDMGDAEQISRRQMQAWLEQNAIYASPHSQRSRGYVQVRVPGDGEWGVRALIDLIEGRLQTAVQSAVKREDEQRFALLNGQNPMFCEDAARTIKNALIGRYASFRLRVDHFESLHAHNAVAICSYP